MRLAILIVVVLSTATNAVGQDSQGEPRLLEFEGPFGRPTVSFAADCTLELNGAKSTCRLIQVPNRVRWEILGRATVILYTDLWVSYSMVPNRKMYIEVDQRNSPARSDGPNAARWTVKRLDSDTDQGLVRTRYHAESTHANGDTFTATMWLAEAYNLVVESRGTSFIRGKTIVSHFKLSNIQIGPQDPALFYPPPDYQRMGTGLDPMPGGKPQGAVSP